MTNPAGELPGHVFISYVREDREQIDRLQTFLEAGGVRVWRDTENLFPGADWRIEIRRAITQGSLVFLACFSSNSAARESTYQNEELVLAVEQYRKRPPGRAWLVPIRLTDCELPAFDLGAGRTLDSIQRVDLFGDQAEPDMARLLSTVLGLLAEKRPTGGAAVPPAIPISEERSEAPSARATEVGITSPPPVRDFAKQLNKPEFEVDVEQAVSGVVSDLLRSLTSEEFGFDDPSLSGPAAEALALLVGRAQRYQQLVAPLCELLVSGCAYGAPQHDRLWARTVAAVGNTRRVASGKTVLLDMQAFPVVVLGYAGALAAVQRNNFHALKAVCVDATVTGEDRQPQPAISLMHPYLPFQHAEQIPQALAYGIDREFDVALFEEVVGGRLGRRYTPMPDYLHAALRPLLSSLVFGGAEYDDLFDRTEVLLDLIATHEKSRAKAQGRYVHGPWSGRFTWRGRHANRPIELIMQEELLAQGSQWPPLLGGLFQGDPTAAQGAFEELLPHIQRARSQMW
jgi:hypothetical protein